MKSCVSAAVCNEGVTSSFKTFIHEEFVLVPHSICERSVLERTWHHLLVRVKLLQMVRVLFGANGRQHFLQNRLFLRKHAFFVHFVFLGRAKKLEELCFHCAHLLAAALGLSVDTPTYSYSACHAQ